MKLIIRLGLFITSAVFLNFVSAATENFKVHRYTSPSGWNVNSYLLESEQGVVVIDAQLFRSDAQKLSDMIANTNKPLAGVIVTHPHVDHFAGLTRLREEHGDFPIYATQATAERFQSVNDQFVSWGVGSYGDEVETQVTLADHIVESGETVTLAGIDLLIDDLGHGEAVDNIVIYQPDTKLLFTGDVTQPHHHYYIGDGYPSGALDQLKHVYNEYSDAKMLYSGHGDPSYLNITKSNYQYIKLVMRLTKKALKNPDNLGPSGIYLTAEARQEVADKIVKKEPYLGDFTFGASYFVTLNVFGVEWELANKQP